MAETKTGIDVIREVLIARNKKLNLARFATEVGIPTSQFHDFIAGKAVPPASVLQAMTKWLWGSATYDAERNLLIAGDTTPAKTLPSYPTRASVPEWTNREYVGLPQPDVKAKQPPKPLSRAGWVSQFGAWT